jgi:uncharacterized protein YciI
MKHFIIELTYTVSAERLAEIVVEHRAFLATGYARGWLLMSGPQAPRVGGMVVARAPSLEAIQQFFQDDPYQVKGAATYRFVEFEPVRLQEWMKGWVSGE